MLIALGLLGAVYAVAKLSTPDSTLYLIPGYNEPAGLHDYLMVLYRNSLVLALHAMACVAGFMAGSSLPLSASQAQRRVALGAREGRPAGDRLRGLRHLLLAPAPRPTRSAAARRRWPSSSARAPGVLLLALTPHALPELVALFLPLAAWIVASRNDDWQDLLAATFVTVAIAVPVLLASAAVEIWVTPEILRAIGS